MTGPGWTVWELAPERSDYPPRGGTVLDVFDLVDDYGEAHVAYRILNRNHGRADTIILRADQVDADQSCPPNTAFLGDAVKLLARTVAHGGRLTDRQCSQVADMGRIVATIRAPR